MKACNIALQSTLSVHCRFPYLARPLRSMSPAVISHCDGEYTGEAYLIVKLYETVSLQFNTCNGFANSVHL